MKFTITLHPVSLAVGAAALGGVLWLVSATQAATHSASGSQLPVTLGAPIEVKGIPVPGLIVRLTDGDFPYTVPANRTFVITGCVPRTSAYAIGNLSIGGQQVAYVFMDTTGFGGGVNISRFGSGLVAKAGEVVDLVAPGAGGAPTNATLIGYLSN